MTQDQIRRIREAMAECDKQIAREMAYSPTHRDAKSIEFHQQHKAKLQAMMEAK